MKTTVSEKGQITIPKALRERLGLEAGVILDFHEEAGCLVGKKRVPEDALVNWRGRGRLPGKARSAEDYLAKIRRR